MTIGQGPRGFDPYFDAQQGNLDHMRRLPHFYALVEPVNTLYELAIQALDPRGRGQALVVEVNRAPKAESAAPAAL